MKIVVINREDRPERLKESQKQFEKYDMEVDVFPAVINGWRGCRDSHLAVLEKYKDKRYIMILEDDVLFLDNPWKPIAYAMNELPNIWSMLYLGISPQGEYVRYSPHLFKVNGGHTTHAIIWDNKPKGVVEYILQHRNEIQKWDVYLSTVIHKLFECFVIYPILCVQRQEQSDTCHRSDASSILHNYNKYCK
jgi:GR25 family glycosyltransferase involved in LPS biosynthesis